jgi:hypothetical protein
LVTELELQLFDKISISESELSTNGLIQTSPISNLQPDRDDTFESILSNQKQPIIASSTNNAGGIASGLSMCMTLKPYPYSIFIQRKNIILFLIMIRIRVIQSNLVIRKFLVIAKSFTNARLFTIYEVNCSLLAVSSLSSRSLTQIKNGSMLKN